MGLVFFLDFFWVSTKWFKILGIFWVTKHGSHQYCWCGADSDKNYFLQHLNGICSFKHHSWKILELLNKNCPVNLHPLFSFWKHGLVCNFEKKWVQSMGRKKQGAKRRVIVIQKEKTLGCLFSFWITLALYFSPCCLHVIFCTQFFKISRP